MKASLSIIKQYINFELPPITELVEKINSQLGGVEEVIDMAAKYKDVTVVKVVECSKHPNADKLNICKVDAGSGDLVQVVCGAPNVKAGMWAAWLPPSSTVPSTFAEDEPFVLGTRELRGVMSNGMLASMKELDLGDDHDGILEIDATQPTASGDEVREGSSFARLYGLDDYVIDIENKMFTHRPDLFGQIGIAREIAGIFGKQFEDENWYWQRRAFENATGLKLQPFNDVPEKVSRIMFVAIKDVTIAPSPLWMKCALASMGSKSISNIVDSTNYLMLVTAQPTHAYDYDKVRGGIIGARLARENEKITLLNGKEYTLSQDDIVIADGEGIYVDKGVHAGMLIAALQSFLEEYYEKKLDVRVNPFYFPFTEPSFEFSLSCPFCDKAGCNICSQAGWIELLGCGMIHPNVLRAADIDPNVYTGFAWGGGVAGL